MSKFKVGDKVRCVMGDPPTLIPGAVYTVIGSDGGLFYLAEVPTGWRDNRFELVEPREFRTGDQVRCVAADGGLRHDWVYTVTGVCGGYLHVNGVSGGPWHAWRFELVEQEPVELAPARNQALTNSNTLPLDLEAPDRSEWVERASQILTRGGVNLRGHTHPDVVDTVSDTVAFASEVLARHPLAEALTRHVARQLPKWKADLSEPNRQHLPRSREPTDQITRSEHQTRWGLMRVELNWRTEQAVFTLDPAEGIVTLDPTTTRVNTEAPVWGGRQVHDTNTAAAIAACMVSGRYLEPNRLTVDRARTARTQEQAAAEAARLPGPGTDAEWGEP